MEKKEANKVWTKIFEGEPCAFCGEKGVFVIEYPLRQRIYKIGDKISCSPFIEHPISTFGKPRYKGRLVYCHRTSCTKKAELFKEERMEKADAKEERTNDVQ